MNDLTVFEYGPTGTQVRTVEIDGEPWFVARDVCEALDITNTTQAVVSLDFDERSLFNIGRQGVTNIISEPGLYSLILRSRKPEAKQFKRWITHEVLPTIRKTNGAYLSKQKTEELLADPDLIISLAQQVKQIRQERDEAIRTKAQIGSRREATAMGTAGAAVKELNKLKKQLYIEGNFLKAKAIPWVGVMFKSSGMPQTYVRSFWITFGQHLTKWCAEHGYETVKVKDVDFHMVNAYPQTAVNSFYAHLLLNPYVMGIYRRENPYYKGANLK